MSSVGFALFASFAGFALFAGLALLSTYFRDHDMRTPSGNLAHGRRWWRTAWGGGSRGAGSRGTRRLFDKTAVHRCLRYLLVRWYVEVGVDRSQLTRQIYL